MRLPSKGPSLNIAVIVWNIIHGRGDRGAWLIYGAFLVVALLVMLLQIRAARIAVPLAVPACALLVGSACWAKGCAARQASSARSETPVRNMRILLE